MWKYYTTGILYNFHSTTCITKGHWLSHKTYRKLMNPHYYVFMSFLITDQVTLSGSIKSAGKLNINDSEHYFFHGNVFQESSKYKCCLSSNVPYVWYVDAIKQNESDLDSLVFKFNCIPHFVIYIFLKLNQNWNYGSRDVTILVLRTIKYKGIWMLLFIISENWYY